MKTDPIKLPVINVNQHQFSVVSLALKVLRNEPK